MTNDEEKASTYFHQALIDSHAPGGRWALLEDWRPPINCSMLKIGNGGRSGRDECGDASEATEADQEFPR